MPGSSITLGFLDIGLFQFDNRRSGVINVRNPATRGSEFTVLYPEVVPSTLSFVFPLSYCYLFSLLFSFFFFGFFSVEG